MNETAVSFRNAGRQVAAEYMQESLAVTLSLGAALIWLNRLEGPLRLAAITLAATLLILRLAAPPYKYFTTVYSVDHLGATMRRGLLMRKTVSVTWKSVTAVKSQSAWAQKLFDVSTVSFSQGGENAEKLTFHGVNQARRRSLEARVIAAGVSLSADAQSEPVRPGSTSELSGPIGSDDLLYSMRPWDLVVVGLVQGQAVMIAPAALLAARETLDELGLSRHFDGFTAQLGEVGSLLFLLAVGALLGIVGTIGRFYRFQIGRRTDGSLEVHYGSLNMTRRVVHPESLVGVAVRQNAAEALLGRVRLVLLARDSRGGVSSDIAFPSLNEASIAEVLQLHFPAFAGSIRWSTTSRASRALRGLLATAALIGLGVGLGLVLDRVLPRILVLGIVVSTLVALYLFARLLTASLDSPAAGLLRGRTCLGSERQTVVHADSVHGWTTFDGPTGTRQGRHVFSTVHYFASRPRRLSALFVQQGVLDLLVPGRSFRLDSSTVGSST